MKRKMNLFTLLLLAGIFVLVACGSTQPTGKEGVLSDPVKVNFTQESFPKIDGSTATIPLSEGIVMGLLEMTEDEAKSFVVHNKTHPAYVNLIEGDADIIFVTEPSDEELRLAREKGIELEVIPVVKDAFVFLVNTQNPISSLKLQEIKDIYQGKITNWKEVGGEDIEIIPYQRPKNSGSQTIMENLVMKNLEIMDAPTEFKPEGMGELIERVAGYDNSQKALGYSVYYYANTMYTRDTIKLIGVDGVKPDKETIKSNRYPLSSAYYAVLRKDEAADSSARLLLKWLLSQEGQKVAEESGYISVK
ncbi:ABC-type phosphate transport system, periplasmic component [Clostridium aceticum]|uniref:ABC-type phosphate transport system, periplasmic component n=1 Tax=Clostridium aceticum TaxID=84022 RepID=A0A0G3WCA2_9CLOT|nr:substrate-binding domain-containing protein [Clostridium aceticum]AKL95948.1 ABC-type phosphate transport system, periplasmic component [Clostridium aceticum]